MGPTHIRPYELTDQSGVEWLYTRTPPAGRTYVRSQAVPADLREINRSFEHCLVAIEPTIDGDALTGIVCLAALDTDQGSPEPDFVHRGHCIRIRHMLVAPERQRRGIGRELMGAAIQWARASGYATIVLETTSQQEAAVAFYQSLAFREIGRSMIGRWQLVWFQLDL